MDAKSRLKVISAGFIILRSDDKPGPQIKCRRKGSKYWETFQNFPNTQARDSRLKQLLELSTCIQD
jgi:hypothetical protein